MAGIGCCALLVPDALAETPPPWISKVARLIAAYPGFLDRIEGNELVWKDGARMVIDDGKEKKSLEARLATPDIKDQFHVAYPVGRAGVPPAPDFDPGRVRNAVFFEKMYGKCAPGQKPGHLVSVAWLPGHGGQTLEVTKINGVADRLGALSRELAALPPTFRKFLKPSAGAYNCRVIAGTDRASAHGYGIAIDLNPAESDYWRWSKPDGAGLYPYRNRIPWEIVEIFEKHGFIWGGKWYHYDTMHFEYRPELIAR